MVDISSVFGAPLCKTVKTRGFDLSLADETNIIGQTKAWVDYEWKDLPLVAPELQLVIECEDTSRLVASVVSVMFSLAMAPTNCHRPSLVSAGGSLMTEQNLQAGMCFADVVK